MVEFDGGIAAIDQRHVSGLVRAVLDGRPQPISLALHFRTRGAVGPCRMMVLADGWIDFEFRLSDEFQGLGWAEFLGDFVAVVAICRNGDAVEPWPVPICKLALAPLNETALKADKLREYRHQPTKDGRAAAFTIAYNEHTILPLWARYYARQFGAENVYILDHGSDRPYEDLPDGVTVTRLPRVEFDNWLILRIVSFYQRFLLEAYDSVLYTDSDEFVCASPDVLAGQALPAFLLALAEPIGITRGYNLHHNILAEAAYDRGRPVLSQRRVMTRQPDMDKPLISRVPLNWYPGFHNAREGGAAVPGLFMLHLRFFDLNTTLIKSGHYRASKWNPDDLAKGLGHHQLIDAATIVSEFRDRSESFARVDDAAFDQGADVSIVPDWMREAIFV